jgi:hypothetical protein
MSAADDPDPPTSEDEIELEYPYVLSWTRVLLAPPFCAGVAAACLFSALTNERAVRLWGVLRLPAPLVNVLAGLAGVGFGVLAVVGVVDLFNRLRTRRRMALTRGGVLVPGDRGREQLVPFQAMTRIESKRSAETNELHSLTIESLAGNFTIENFMLPAGALEELAKTLTRAFERHHRPDLVRDRERFQEDERRREEQYQATRRAIRARAPRFQVVAQAAGEATSKSVAAFATADKAREYADFLRGSNRYEWVRVEEDDHQ